MGLAALHLVAQWAGATAYVSLLAAIVAAAIGYGFSNGIDMPTAEAYRLGRHMALLGGIAVLIAGTTSTFYWWMQGVASDRAALLVEMGLLGLTAVFALVVALLLDRGERARTR